jgi:hypothetical protein
LLFEESASCPGKVAYWQIIFLSKLSFGIRRLRKIKCNLKRGS